MITQAQATEALARCASLKKRAFCLRWLRKHEQSGRVPRLSVELARRILNQNPL